MFEVFLLSTVLFTNLFTINTKEVHVFPFTSIKIIDNNIFFTLDNVRSDWHRLLSIDNIGADVFIRKAKENFGLLNCDYEIACYKYNLITDFEKVYEISTKEKLPLHVSVEYMEKNVKKQTGIDIESTSEKYTLYKSFKEQNIKGNFINTY